MNLSVTYVTYMTIVVHDVRKEYIVPTGNKG